MPHSTAKSSPRCGCTCRTQPQQHDQRARDEAAEAIPQEGIAGKEELLGQQAGDVMREQQSPDDPDAGIRAAGKDAEIRSSVRKTEPLRKFLTREVNKPKGRGER